MKLRWGKAASGVKKEGSSETVPAPETAKGDGTNGGSFVADGLVPEVHEDDVFFDPRPWPVSDGEDDFYSVNGDLTPTRGSTPSRSCGSTPKHQHQSLSPRMATNASNVGGEAASTRTGAHSNSGQEVAAAAPKRRFGGILKRTNRRGAASGGNPVVPASTGNGGGLPPKPAGDGDGRARVSSGELGDGGGGKKSRGGGGMGLQCCIPSLGRSKRRQQHAVENAAVP